MDDEHDAVLALERGQREAQRLQPFGARAFHELEVVGVVDDAGGVGVLVVNADGEAEGQESIPVDRRCALPPQGAMRPWGGPAVAWRPCGAHSLGNRSLAAPGTGGARPKCRYDKRGGHAAARRALQVTLLDEEGLQHVLDRVALLADGRGEIVDADRAAVEFGEHGLEELAVHDVEAGGVDIEHRQRGVGHRARDLAVAPSLPRSRARGAAGG